MFYAYVRVSTRKQIKDRQRENIANYCGKNGIDYSLVKFYEDEYTGCSLNRPAWEKLFKKATEGDTIIFDEVSRMSRNAEDGYKAYKDLFDRKVNLVFLKEPHINTDVYKKGLETLVSLTGTNVDFILEGVNKYLSSLAEEQVKLAFETAQKERDFLSQRTIEGIKASKKKSGHKYGDTYETRKAHESKQKILELSSSFNGTLSDKKTMEYIGISKPTFYKYKKQLLEDKGRE